MAMHEHPTFGHDHGASPYEISAAMMTIILVVIATLLLLGVVFAWNPWAGGGSTTPGQGGENEPAQEQQISPPQTNLAPFAI